VSHHEIAVASLPAGHAIAIDGVHVDVHGQQVVAPLGAVGQHVVDEVGRVQALSLKASLHVGDGQHDGVEPSGGYSGLELFDG
jgi:hypothetical protein